jgi:uncharacterized membrane protein YhaH (DUF805 family)
MSTQGGPYDPYSTQLPAYAAPNPPTNPDGYYLYGARVSARESLDLAFTHAFVYWGRASRSAYWWFALFLVLVGCGLDFWFREIVDHSDSVEVTFWVGLVPVSLVVIGLLIPTLALSVRRLHDIDRSGFWLFIALVPFVGAIVLLLFFLLAGTRGPNRFV